jgi:hypothetical protein
MHDGSIIHDERTALGQVASTARKVMYTIPTITEEDDLAGVSALMKALPGKIEPRKRKKSAVSKKSARKPVRRQKKTKQKARA